MKVRIWGSAEECKEAQELFLRLKDNPKINSVEVSRLYPNRPPSSAYRVYIDIQYNQTVNSNIQTKKRLKK